MATNADKMLAQELSRLIAMLGCVQRREDRRRTASLGRSAYDHLGTWPHGNQDAIYQPHNDSLLIGDVELSVCFVQWPREGEDWCGWERRWLAKFKRLGQDQVWYYPVLSQNFIVSPSTSVTLSSLSPAWNNANNTVEGVGGGGSGGAVQQNTNSATGGGGGEYRRISNFTDPGGATSLTIGTGGAAKATTVGGGSQSLAGADGTSTTFNTSSVIAIFGKAGAAGAVPQNGGVGGTGGTGAAGNNNGGRGGNTTTNGTNATGGGGAGGPNGAGVAGTDTSTAGTATAGGQGDGTSGGAGGAGSTTGGSFFNGTAGTELGDTIHGCGGGGGASRTSLNSAQQAGSGALYGAGGAGCSNGGTGGNGSTKATSGAGANGIIVLTWTAAVVGVTYFSMSDSNLPMGLLRREIVGY